VLPLAQTPLSAWHLLGVRGPAFTATGLVVLLSMYPSMRR
jgi:hypothetical protein